MLFRTCLEILIIINRVFNVYPSIIIILLLIYLNMFCVQEAPIHVIRDFEIGNLRRIVHSNAILLKLGYWNDLRHPNIKYNIQFRRRFLECENEWDIALSTRSTISLNYFATMKMLGNNKTLIIYKAGFISQLVQFP